MSIRSEYDEQLNNLDQSVVHMGEMVTGAVSRAIDALQTGNLDQAKEIIQGDEAIDQEERSIEHACLTLLLRQQPVARDLRRVSTALKMVTDLERIGDHAADIAEIIPHLVAANATLEEGLTEMCRKALEMARLSIQAFVQGDLEQADQVIEMDDLVDQAFNQVKRSLAKDMTGEAEVLQDAAIDQLMIAKYAERIGDHAVNLAQWVKFCETGIYREERIV